MDRVVVYQKMRELEIKIHYHFNDIEWLSKAMRSEKIEVSGEGKNHSEYTNDGLATIGDTVLKSVIADYLYRKGITTKGEITQIKSKLENNEVMLTRFGYLPEDHIGVLNITESEQQYSASDLKPRFGKIEYTVPFSSTIREQYMVGSLTEQTKDKKFNSAFESIKERLVR